MKAIDNLRILPFIASIALFAVSFLIESYQVTSTTQFGLLQIQLPFSGVAFPMLMLAVALILFASCFNILHRRIEMYAISTRRAAIGSAVLSLGFTVFLFSLLILWILDSDYSTRCNVYCSQTLIQSHILDVQLLWSGVIISLIVGVFGLLFLTRTARRM